ncbi:MAG: class I SAM-dependent methyltransferase [Rhodanobacteraceae bacterium]
MRRPHRDHGTPATPSPRGGRPDPARTLETNRRFHDRVAGRYDDVYATPLHRLLFDLAWSAIEPLLPRDLSIPVADLGCGTGLYGLRMAKSGYRVTLSDLSEKMLEQARRKAEGLRATPEFLRADVADLSALADGQFGLITALGEPLSMTPDPQQALREFARVLRPDGAAAFTVDQRLACLDLIAEHGSFDELEQLLATGGTTWLTDNPAERFPLTTWSFEEVEALCRRAGLAVADCYARTVLPWRKLEARGVFEDEARVRRLVALEKKYARQVSARGRAAHLLVVARRTER